MNKTVRLILLFIVVFAVGFAASHFWKASRKAPEVAELAPGPAAAPPAPEVVPPPAPEPAPEPARPAARPRSRPATQPSSPRPASQPAPASAPYTPPPPEPTPAPRTEPSRAARTRQVSVPQGTELLLVLNTALTTKTAQPDDAFTATVKHPVQVGDIAAIPEGSLVRGRVAHVQRAGRVKGRAELGLEFIEVELPGGRTYDLAASLAQLDQGEKETVGEEGQIEGEGSKKRDAVTIGAAGGIGAVIGAIAGGKKGAGTGAATGAGAGAAIVLLTRGKDVELAQGSEIAVKLDRPLVVEVK